MPIDTAKAVIPELQAHHMVSHAYIGIRGEEVADPMVALDDGAAAAAAPGVRVESVDAGGAPPPRRASSAPTRCSRAAGT